MWKVVGHTDLGEVVSRLQKVVPGRSSQPELGRCRRVSSHREVGYGDL